MPALPILNGGSEYGIFVTLYRDQWCSCNLFLEELNNLKQRFSTIFHLYTTISSINVGSKEVVMRGGSERWYFNNKQLKIKYIIPLYCILHLKTLNLNFLKIFRGPSLACVIGRDDRCLNRNLCLLLRLTFFNQKKVNNYTCPNRKLQMSLMANTLFYVFIPFQN